MSSVRKYVLKPYESSEQSNLLNDTNTDHTYAITKTENAFLPEKTKPSKNFIKERAKLKMENILKIITSIALVNGYDNQRRIRSSNGKFITNTNIIDLIMHAMQPGKVIRGENEFVNLLREAKVDPNWLFNENVKSKLNTYSSYEINSEKPEIIKQYDQAPTFVQKTSPIQAKRKSSDDLFETTNNKKRKLDWDYSDDE